MSRFERREHILKEIRERFPDGIQSGNWTLRDSTERDELVHLLEEAGFRILVSEEFQPTGKRYYILIDD